MSTSRPVAALAQDGSPVSLRQALLPLVEEFLRHRGSSAGGSGGSLAASVAAPSSPGAAGAPATEAVQSLPGTPVARSSSLAEDGGGTPVARPTAEAELPAAAETSAGQLGATDGEEASGSSAAAAAAGPAAPAPAPAAKGSGVDEKAAAAAGDATRAGEAAALLEQAAADRLVLVAGTCPPLEVPLAWLHAWLHAPDFFLYVVLHLPLAR